MRVPSIKRVCVQTKKGEKHTRRSKCLILGCKSRDISSGRHKTYVADGTYKLPRTVKST